MQAGDRQQRDASIILEGHLKGSVKAADRYLNASRN